MLPKARVQKIPGDMLLNPSRHVAKAIQMSPVLRKAVCSALQQRVNTREKTGKITVEEILNLALNFREQKQEITALREKLQDKEEELEIEKEIREEELRQLQEELQAERERNQQLLATQGTATETLARKKRK